MEKNRGKEMKKIVAVLAGALVSSSVLGAEWLIQAKVTNVTPMYKETTEQIPYQSCQVVQVPIYDKASDGDVLLGTVIGGILGNQVGEGKGKDAATVVGAIMGAHKAQEGTGNIIGYRNVNQCSTQYKSKTVSRVTHYNVELDAGGDRVMTTLYREVRIGDIINVKKTVEYTIQQ
jgi:uncharacterized protein YcfJ